MPSSRGPRGLLPVAHRGGGLGPGVTRRPHLRPRGVPPLPAGWARLRRHAAGRGPGRGPARHADEGPLRRGLRAGLRAHADDPPPEVWRGSGSRGSGDALSPRAEAALPRGHRPGAGNGGGQPAGAGRGISALLREPARVVVGDPPSRPALAASPGIRPRGRLRPLQRGGPPRRRGRGRRRNGQPQARGVAAAARNRHGFRALLRSARAGQRGRGGAEAPGPRALRARAHPKPAHGGASARRRESPGLRPDPLRHRPGDRPPPALVPPRPRHLGAGRGLLRSEGPDLDPHPALSRRTARAARAGPGPPRAGPGLRPRPHAPESGSRGRSARSPRQRRLRGPHPAPSFGNGARLPRAPVEEDCPRGRAIVAAEAGEVAA